MTNQATPRMPDVLPAGMRANVTPSEVLQMAQTINDLVAALREGAGHDRDVNAMRELSHRFVDNAPISGADKGAAAEIIAEYARFIRVARAALAKVEQS